MLKLLEKGFAVCMLTFCCGAFTLYFSGGRALDLTDSNSGLFALQFGVYAIAAVLFLLNAKKVWGAASHSPGILLVVLFAIASTAWAQDPSIALRRSLVFGATVLYGIYFGSRFELGEQISLIARTLLLVLVASAALAILVPSLGRESDIHLGSWRGLFPQKNMLAKVAVLAAVSFSFWAPRNRLLSRLALAFAVLITVLTGSVTGIVVLPLILVIHSSLRAMKGRFIFTILASVLIVTFLFTIINLLEINTASTLAFLKRDATLSGRTALWRLVLTAIGKQPLLGYGFNAFWLQTTLQAEFIIRSAGWKVPHAHNGILEIWLELGAIGVALCLLAYGRCVFDAVQVLSLSSSRDSLWPLVYLSFLFLYNITEVTTPQANSIFTVVFVATAVRVAMIRRAAVDPRPVYAGSRPFVLYPSASNAQT